MTPRLVLQTLAFLSLILLGQQSLDAATPVPGALPSGPFALLGGMVHTLTSDEPRIATLLVDQGKIIAIDPTLTLPDKTVTIDVSGKHIYPGMFQSLTDLGLIEISSVRGTLDQAETGTVNPNVRAEVAINPDSELIPVTRSNGVLLALSVPQGRLITGSSAVWQLDGWTGDEMTLHAPAAIHVQWPVDEVKRKEHATESDKHEATPYAQQMQELEHAFLDARAYQERRVAGATEVDLRWDAMLPLLKRDIPLIVHADDQIAIQQSVAFAERHKVRLIICGGYEAPLCADLLKTFDVPVIISSVYRLPRHRDAAYDEPYTLPARLHALGIRYCIAGGGRFEASNARNLPYHAATAVAYGLPPQEGIKAITLYPAQILGVDNRVGSLAPGKDATLIVTTGDPLETTTRIEMAWIAGKRVDLDNRQTQLWRKYREKYRNKSRSEVQDISAP